MQHFDANQGEQSACSIEVYTRRSEVTVTVVVGFTKTGDGYQGPTVAQSLATPYTSQFFPPSYFRGGGCYMD